MPLVTITNSIEADTALGKGRQPPLALNRALQNMLVLCIAPQSLNLLLIAGMVDNQSSLEWHRLFVYCC